MVQICMMLRDRLPHLCDERELALICCNCFVAQLLHFLEDFVIVDAHHEAATKCERGLQEDSS
jgi:hypothetical protein